MLELEHTISNTVSSKCTNVDQVIVDSRVENCNKILLDAATEWEMIFTSKQRNKVVKTVKKPWFNRECFIKRKEYFKQEIQVGKLNQLKIELIAFVVVKHTKRRLTSSTMHIKKILFLSFWIWKQRILNHTGPYLISLQMKIRLLWTK